LTVDLPGHDFKAGDVGTVVHIYRDGIAYELEIFSADVQRVSVVTVKADQVRPVSRRDVLHVRQLVTV
jgi:hypothetical protein